MYEEYFVKPNSPKSHMLLHTEHKLEGFKVKKLHVKNIKYVKKYQSVIDKELTNGYTKTIETNKNSQEDNQHGDKEKENAVPEIIDNVEALEAKMKAMREAQKNLLLTHRNR